MFKVIIERPGTDGRPKTADEHTGAPFLEVPIPSYRIGVPRFSMRGTAFIRSSSYSTTGDARSSIFSHDTPQRDRNSLHPAAMISRRHSHASPQVQYLLVSPSSPMGGAPLPSPAICPSRVTIEPAMFDALTFKPACDAPSLVRYSAQGKTITAATPPRLVAEITSPTFVDYDLLSDFFLTFRSFLPASQLLQMLVARLRWALARDDEVGMVVRVRTFVAMRHWILNYFMDDFVVDYELRLLFCELLNNFVDDIIQSPVGGKNRLKILGELKKCWRRTCGLYWDGIEFANYESPIVPGGVAGSRDPDLTPSFWEKPADPGPPQIESILEHEDSEPAYFNFFAGAPNTARLDTNIESHRTSLPTAEGHELHQDAPLSPTSILSETVISCSFPTKSRLATLGNQHPLGVHLVPASSRYDSSPPVAHTPKTVTGKRSQPSHSHKRSGSFSDSLRDERRQPVQAVVYKSTEVLMALPYAGSLVRGNLFPPGQSFVDVVTPSTLADSVRAPNYFDGAVANQKGPSAMSGPGMKKLLGSVRRAISKRTGPNTTPSPTFGNFSNIAPLGARGATVNRLPGSAIVPHGSRRNTGTPTPPRVDILGAGIAEDFRRAVREDEEADADRRRESHPSIGVASGNELMYPSMQLESTPEPEGVDARRRVASGLTNGSKSIVIMDDTLPLEGLSVMAGALPVNPSTETFADAFMQPSGGPTPPSTPPELPVGSPRRSSHLLGGNTYNRHRSLSPQRTPSLTLDANSPSDLGQSPSHRPFGRQGMPSFGRSFKSNRSLSLRRYASYQSGYTRLARERSFDATTFSGDADRLSAADPAQAPEPLRVLRRRPGGDLRAVTNVGDLNFQPLRRPRSTGSLTTYSDSVRSSYLLSGEPSGYVAVVNSDDFSHANAGTFSLGALTEAPPKKLSLFSTHSSQPVMRASFEAEAKKLAQIPDDVNDDGGVESALAKLEGKFEQRQSDISVASLSKGVIPTSVPYIQGVVSLEHPSDEPTEEDEKRHHRLKHIVENGISKTPPLPDSIAFEVPTSHNPLELQPTVYVPHQAEDKGLPMKSQTAKESVLSLPSHLRDEVYTKEGRRQSRNWSNLSILRGPSLELERPQVDEFSQENSHLEFDFCEGAETEHLEPPRAFPRHSIAQQSFLDLDSDDDASSLSSEMSLEVISRTEYLGEGSTSTFPPIRPGTVVKEIALPSHPLRHPSSPTNIIGQALPLPLVEPREPELHAHQLHQPEYKPLPPTPDITPTVPEAFGKRSWEKNDNDRPLSTSSEQILALQATSDHLPFVLAFDSKVLAQQFTLIEKDALNEIDWKELIDMRWKNATSNPRSWVEFLRTQEARGVEVVIARFNIMVKWAVSECVLTHNLEERVQTIIKYIHIAAHCRRYRNYATMYQLTVALTSNDMSRLTQTWAHVPPQDIATLKELEALAQPSRNFYNLRAEMEGAGADRGCIPFVGIYTHDLLFNSQRPSQIASTPTTEPLVNFEKCRTAAAIVKNLLRLLEASSLYRFQPIEGVTERCLWMAALSDEEIRRCASAIE